MAMVLDASDLPLKDWSFLKSIFMRLARAEAGAKLCLELSWFEYWFAVFDCAIYSVWFIW